MIVPDILLPLPMASHVELNEMFLYNSKIPLLDVFLVNDDVK